MARCVILLVSRNSISESINFDSLVCVGLIDTLFVLVISAVYRKLCRHLISIILESTTTTAVHVLRIGTRHFLGNGDVVLMEVFVTVVSAISHVLAEIFVQNGILVTLFVTEQGVEVHRIAIFIPARGTTVQQKIVVVRSVKVQEAIQDRTLTYSVVADNIMQRELIDIESVMGLEAISVKNVISIVGVDNTTRTSGIDVRSGKVQGIVAGMMIIFIISAEGVAQLLFINISLAIHSIAG